jgi:flagellar biosynthesis protein FlhG
VVVAGGKGGVGTTTIAVNLAAALARQEKRAVLADLSPAGGAVIFCRVAGRGTVADVLAGRRTAAEILEPGPAGIHVLPGQWESGETWSSTASAEEHLIEQLQGLLPIADFVVIDAGNSPTRIARRLWLASDRVLLVTTPELASLRNVFAAAKSLGTGNDAMCVDTVVNMVPTAAAAHDVHSRLALACRRFLGLRLRPAGHVRRATHVEDAGRQATPFVLASPACHASRQMGHLARFVAGT